jgi:hypothetical protein
MKMSTSNNRKGRSILVWLSLFFSTLTFAQTGTIDPADGATDVPEDKIITVTYTGAVRIAPNTEITNLNVASLITFKLTDENGANVDFTATINAGKTVITVTPTEPLFSFTTYYFRIASVRTGGSTDIGPYTSTFTTGDSSPPTLTFSPEDNAIQVPIATQITITANEPIENTDGSEITEPAALIRLKEGGDGGTDVDFTATINPGKTLITITPTGNLTSDSEYFVEIVPVQDAAGNETTAQSITFFTVDTTPPVLSFTPENGAENVVESTLITIASNEPLRKSGGDELVNADLVSPLIQVRVGSAAGDEIPFTASINGGKTIITITPTSPLPGNTVIFVRIGEVEDEFGNATTAQSITFTTDDTLPPVALFNPSNGATGVFVNVNPTITFNEPIRQLGGDVIANEDLGSLVEFKLTNAGGAVVPASFTITGNQTVTIIPDANLTPNTVYYLAMSVVEDVSGNAQPDPQSITFTTELPPSVTSFTPTEVCAGTEVTLTGLRFTASSTVTINGVNATIVGTPTATTITIQAPGGDAVGAFPVVVTNERGLSGTSAGNLTIKPALAPTLPIAADPPFAIVGGSSTIKIQNTQTGVSYRLYRTEPGPESTVGGPQAGNGGELSFGTGNLNTPGTYTYVVRATSTNCSAVDYGPVQVTVAELSAAAGDDRAICVEESTQLGGNPTATGGTTFYNYLWTSTPAGFTSAQPNPAVSPTETTTYHLRVEDSSGAFVLDEVVVTVNVPIDESSLNIILNPTKADDVYQSNDDRVNLRYELNGILQNIYPNGTRFEGPGVNSSGTLKYFYPNAANFGDNDIKLIYVNPQGCITEKIKTVTVVSSGDLINGLENTYCEEDIEYDLTINEPQSIPTETQFYGYRYIYIGPIELYNYPTASYITPSPTSGFRIDGTDSKKIYINPELIGPGDKKFEIVYRIEFLEWSGDPSNPTLRFEPYIVKLSEFFRVTQKPELVTNIPSRFCENDEPFQLIGKPDENASGIFRVDDTSAGLTTTGGQTFFNPGYKPRTDPNELSFNIQISYEYTSGSNCTAKIYQPVTIFRLPDFSIEFEDGCQNEEIGFTPTVTTSHNINRYTVNYGDQFSTESIPGSKLDTLLTHSYNFSGDYNVTLSYNTLDNCLSTSVFPIKIGAIPNLSFNWNFPCEDDKTNFLLTSDFPPIDTQEIRWDFGDGNSISGNSMTTVIPGPDPTSGSLENLLHQYNTSGVYQVNASLTSNLGCETIITKYIHKVPTKDLLNEYIDDFGISDYQWTTTSIPSNTLRTSWEYGVATTEKFLNNNSEPLWITNLDGEYLSNEKSYLFSPCYNLDIIERPFIGILFKSLTQEGLDGVVLQMNISNSSEINSDWETVGAINQGLNWFNRFGIVAKPGDQTSGDIGWSGQFINSDEVSNGWFEAKLPIDQIIPALGSDERKKVRFRFAFASQASIQPGFEGVGLKEFKIANRNKILLVENFTNYLSTAATTESGEVNEFISNNGSAELIKVQYHLSIPENDLIYRETRADANARAFFYGISAPPATRLDGLYGTGNFKNTWGPTMYTTRTLENSPLVISGLTANEETNSISALIEKDNVDFEIPDSYRLYFLLVEKEVSGAPYTGTHINVGRKFLPDASGIKVNNHPDLSFEQPIDFRNFPVGVTSADWMVVAFIQDELTREVIQANVLSNPTFLPSRDIVLHTPLTAEKDIHLYPNPANQKAIVRIERLGASPRQLELFDMHGRQVRQAEMSQGDTQVEFDTRDLSPGLYMLQVMERGQLIARKRLVVVH